MKTALSILFATFLSLFAFGQNEKILNFDVDISVNRDRSIDVTEYIRVQAQGREIKRGITRQFPLSRKLNNEKHPLSYEIKSIRKDGAEEAYHSKKSSGNITYYIGKKDVFLKPGIYEYTIEYKVKNQVGFYEDYDEIYWNAIGTQNKFIVENASVKVSVPKGIDIINESAYVGLKGTQQQKYKKEISGNTVYYEASESLPKFAGFTVSVAFPKGVVSPPTMFEKYSGMGFLGLFSLSLFGYMFYNWRNHGQDPPRPDAEPSHFIPDNLSPGSIAYLGRGTYFNSAILASIIDLAKNKYIDIQHEQKQGVFTKSDIFTLVKTNKSPDDLVIEQKILWRELFSYSDTVILDGTYESRIANAKKDFQQVLKNKHHELVTTGNNFRLTGFAFAVWAVFLVILIALKLIIGGVPTMGIILFGIIGLVACIIYGYLIRKPLPEKLEIQSKIAGFKEYMQMDYDRQTEIDNIPDKDLKYYEDLLPYAYALGISKNWNSKFKHLFNEAGNKENLYYYHYMNPVVFNSTFHSSSTQASSSSGGGGGSFGGGSVGGGGGGGGVGGW